MAAAERAEEAAEEAAEEPAEEPAEEAAEEPAEELAHAEVLELFQAALARLVQDPLLCDLPPQVGPGRGAGPGRRGRAGLTAASLARR
ncbi:hypothetical protein DV515_00008014 [Chloebia gouldiae]|uniref:Uncharacterized protein n=1 Tax=Chloebia gouldiae TaxID=44316 RepID=A0A3L8SHB2_CHLGU|nr:hypothetical protein DV515_00008014 [Chloebia gouldiae]